jgi:peroxiredoxin
LAKRTGELKGLAEVAAISVDPPSESQKLDELLDSAFPLLGDSSLRVISSYQMRHQMGGETVGNMGYVIIDETGLVRQLVVDPLFGRHAAKIIESLKGIQ